MLAGTGAEACRCGDGFDASGLGQHTYLWNTSLLRLFGQPQRQPWSVVVSEVCDLNPCPYNSLFSLLWMVRGKKWKKETRARITDFTYSLTWLLPDAQGRALFFAAGAEIGAFGVRPVKYPGPNVEFLATFGALAGIFRLHPTRIVAVTHNAVPSYHFLSS